MSGVGSVGLPGQSATARRKPTGYRGVDHQTTGAALQALFRAVLMPELILGPEIADTLRVVKAHEWYPIEMILKPLDRLDATLGVSSLRKVGSELFALSHEKAFRAQAKGIRDLVFGADRMYHQNNRGIDIGGWRVLEFGPGRAVLEKNTPHHCIMEEGILEGGCRSLGVDVTIYQARCFRRGDATCEFRVSSPIVDHRWLAGRY